MNRVMFADIHDHGLGFAIFRDDHAKGRLAQPPSARKTGSVLVK